MDYWGGGGGPTGYVGPPSQIIELKLVDYFLVQANKPSAGDNVFAKSRE